MSDNMLAEYDYLNKVAMTLDVAKTTNIDGMHKQLGKTAKELGVDWHQRMSGVLLIMRALGRKQQPDPVLALPDTESALVAIRENYGGVKQVYKDIDKLDKSLGQIETKGVKAHVGIRTQDEKLLKEKRKRAYR